MFVEYVVFCILLLVLLSLYVFAMALSICHLLMSVNIPLESPSFFIYCNAYQYLEEYILADISYVGHRVDIIKIPRNSLFTYIDKFLQKSIINL